MPDRPEIISLLGASHYATPATGDDLIKLETELEQAEAELSAAPRDLERQILVGRRLAYLWRYHEAIAVFSKALEQQPLHPAVLRHRGHRLISIRRLGAAGRDLAQANEARPGDFDILYHLGLARWLTGNHAGAVEAYGAYLPHCRDDEERVALAYWLHLSLWRVGDKTGAQDVLERTGSPSVTENAHYLHLLELFRGERSQAQVEETAGQDDLAAGTLGFGLGCWHLMGGRTEAARASFQSVTFGRHWPAFGFIAAEVELARLAGLLPT